MTVKLVSLSIIIERLYNLQVRQAEKYKKLSDDNRINLSFIIPSRGLIVDRNGNTLADNREQYQLLFKLDEVEDKMTALNKVLKMVSIDDNKKKKILASLYTIKNNKKKIIIKIKRSGRKNDSIKKIF